MHVDRRVRYAVVGLGRIAQQAVLPALTRARSSQLSAIVSGDPEKLEALGRRWGVPRRAHYDEYDELLRSGDVDAVYIALPNDLHRDYAVRAAEAGVHVLCEKPMALTENECDEMIAACERNDVRLMVAYRLHFEEANRRAAELVRRGAIGEPRFFISSFALQVQPGDIRLQRSRGGGSLYDIGIYCINAARWIFGEEPIEVSARTDAGGDPQPAEVDVMASVSLRFPEDRFGVFLTSFGAADFSCYRVAGATGWVHVEPAYHYATPPGFELHRAGCSETFRFEPRDQFVPELEHFSDCVLLGRTPEPNGREGLADVRVIEAAHASAQTGRPVRLAPLRLDRRAARYQTQRPFGDEDETIGPRP